MSNQLKIKWKTKAIKDITEIPEPYKSKILGKIEMLSTDPYLGSKLKVIDSYRMRVGDYRVIYKIDFQKEQIELEYIRHRSRVYRNI